MNAYSKDLRLRVLDALDRGLAREGVCELFGISRSTIKRWVGRRRQGEDLEPKPSTGRKRRILATAEERRAAMEATRGKRRGHAGASLRTVGERNGR